MVSPLLETVAAARALRTPDPALAGWRRAVLGGGTPGSTGGPAGTVGAAGGGPVGGPGGTGGDAARYAKAATELVADRGGEFAAAAVLRLSGHRTNWLEDELRELGPAAPVLRGFHRYALTAHWAVLRAALHGDLALRAHELAVFGAQRAVAGLPGLDVTETDRPDGAARRLVLAPSAFRTDTAVYATAEGTVVVYPMTGRARLWAGPGEAEPAAGLGALLGRGRAAALRNIGSGCGTAELAQRLQVSSGTASVHVAALREGGLVTTHRVGKGVRHVLTPVGSMLVSGRTGPYG
ncbi:hypothetical protein [Streptomyces sp. NPDC090025]|uniref:hypothetical protein n=1 Tax=Streptomyces sp. NPDC090025 TaxID=3365922 RepID=UPI003835D705